jgi:hypothetical protein
VGEVVELGEKRHRQFLERPEFASRIGHCLNSVTLARFVLSPRPISTGI